VVNSHGGRPKTAGRAPTVLLILTDWKKIKIPIAAGCSWEIPGTFAEY